MKRLFIIGAVILLSLNAYTQKFNQVAKIPPMGWNSWNKYGCDVSEALIMQMADAMVSSGMKDAGYTYIVIDDCWQVSRDENGEIVADKDKFPHGMKYVADYVHSKGLRFGIYSCAGKFTCQGRPGGLGHEYQDALTYARYGVDYLKYDWCNTSTQDAKSSYSNMRDALHSAGRPIVFSICEWGSNKPWEWAGEVGHLWRTTGDINDSWNSMIEIFESQKDLAKYAGPGHWNDPDMLEVGNGGMTAEEYKTHFSLWCMLASPLMAGNDLQNMSAETKSILTNKEVIALDQDSLGRQASCYRDDGDYQIWLKPLEKDEKAICLLNKSDEKKSVLVDFALLATASTSRWPEPSKFTINDYRVRDLWEHKDLLMKETSVYIDMPPHSVKIFRFIKK
ncbi:MAG: glycoside hydrolase family 27 protein [Bacteroidales bacterium]|jgi:alpha-galactosidase